MRILFKINDTVLYGANGVCKVIDITNKSFYGEEAEYYVLTPLFDTKSTTIFVPVKNENLVAKMRCVISKEEIKELIKNIPVENPEWIENVNARKEKFKEILSKGDRYELARLIKSLYAHMERQQSNGKKLHLSDEGFMKDAERMLYDEFAFVLGIERDEVLEYIRASIEEPSQSE